MSERRLAEDKRHGGSYRECDSHGVGQLHGAFRVSAPHREEQAGQRKNTKHHQGDER
jgi:hypothetical protein